MGLKEDVLAHDDWFRSELNLRLKICDTDKIGELLHQLTNESRVKFGELAVRYGLIGPAVPAATNTAALKE